MASGDLTHRGTRDQHEQAAAVPRSLETPVLAVPGNHDLPYTFPARFTRPWAEFERQWQTTEPTHSSAALARRRTELRPPVPSPGRCATTEPQLRDAAERLKAAPEGAYRVTVLHHHMLVRRGALHASDRCPTETRCCAHSSPRART